MSQFSGMAVTRQQLQEWLNAPEGEHFEFKEAKSNFQFDEPAKYCAALANEGGGKVILGITDKRSRRIVGSQAFLQPERTRQGLNERLRLRISFDEIHDSERRVLVFHIPGRPIGVPIQCDGKFWMRDNDRLVELSTDRLREIFAETGHDFSADLCPAASLKDLDPATIREFRRRWIHKSANPSLLNLTDEPLQRNGFPLTGDCEMESKTRSHSVRFSRRPVVPGRTNPSRPCSLRSR